MLMANGIVPRPLDFSYNSTDANPYSRAVDNNEPAAAEIRRLEVGLYFFASVFLTTDLTKVEIAFTPFSRRAGTG